jgi:mannose-1-phosphate guanylyltransferase
MESKLISRIDAPTRCGILLAGGDGKRLQSFIQRAWGHILPKQYVSFLDGRSMLERTHDRAGKLFASENLFTVVTQDHLEHFAVRRQVAGLPSGTIIVQPENKDTEVGVLLAMMTLKDRYSDATVVIFPTDHFVSEEDCFMGHVEQACREVEDHPSRIVLLGIEPSEAESEYGYIMPENCDCAPVSLVARRVARFVEKPRPILARQLAAKGGLWNTLVMVFKMNTLLRHIKSITPVLYRSFERIRAAIHTSFSKDVVQQVYQATEPVNISKGLLEPISMKRPSPLFVLPVHGVAWSDLGSEKRLVCILNYAARNHRL